MKRQQIRIHWLGLALLVTALFMGCADDGKPNPEITAMEPAIGLPGDTVTVEGFHFGGTEADDDATEDEDDSDGTFAETSVLASDDEDDETDAPDDADDEADDEGDGDDTAAPDDEAEEDEEVRTVTFQEGVIANNILEWTDEKITFTVPDGALSGCLQVNVDDDPSNCATFKTFSGVCEAFEADAVDTAVWQVFGTTQPMMRYPGKKSGTALDIRGDAACDAGIYTAATYPTGQYLLAGLSIKADLVQGGSCMTIRAGFTQDGPATAQCGDDSVAFYNEIAWVEMALDGAEPMVRYEMAGGEFFEEPVDRDKWHAFILALNPDATVSFFRDGIPVFTSVGKIDLSAHAAATRFQVRGKACDAPILVDDICIDGVKVEEAGWTARAPMPTARMGAEAAVVDDKVFVIGGSSETPDAAPLTVVETYNPTADAWSKDVFTGIPWAPLPKPVMNFATAVLEDKIFVIGGLLDEVSTAGVFMLDPKANTWSTMADLPEARHNAGAAVVNDKIYLFGGRSLDEEGNEKLHDTVFSYDFKTDSWDEVTTLPQERADHGVGVYKNKVYLVSGTVTRTDADGWEVPEDPNPDEEEPGEEDPPANGEPDSADKTIAADDTENGDDSGDDDAADGEEEDASDADDDTETDNDADTADSEGLTHTVLVIGDPETDTYENLAIVPVARIMPDAVGVAGRLVALHGHTATQRPQQEFFYFHPREKEWIRLVGYSGDRYRPATAAIDETLFVFGGRGADGTALAETLSITLPNLNTPPVAKLSEDQETSVSVGSDLSITLDGYDAEDDELTYFITKLPENGKLENSESKEITEVDLPAETGPTVTYTPNDDISEDTKEDSFEFKVNDGEFDSESVEVVIQIEAESTPEEPTPESEPEPIADPDKENP